MSRYFDLTQQIGLADSSFPGKSRSSASALAQLSETENQAGACSGEILDLVQRIFLIPAENAPSVVVFAPVSAKRNDDGLCLSVAETLVQVSRRKVCLVEANFRAPLTSEQSGHRQHYGLADALAGEEPISSFCRPMAQDNLWMIPAGALDANSPSLITPERLKSRFAELRAAFEFIIIDAAPLALYAETIILGRMADGVALVLDARSTGRDQAGAAVSSLRALSIPILAAVLSKTESRGLRKLLR